MYEGAPSGAGNEVEKRVSGEKKKGREEKRGGVEAYEYPVRMRRGTRGRMVMMMQTMGTKGEGRFPFRYTRVRYVLGRNRRGRKRRKKELSEQREPC